jgi:hypothetical protein
MQQQQKRPHSTIHVLLVLVCVAGSGPRPTLCLVTASQPTNDSAQRGWTAPASSPAIILINARLAGRESRRRNTIFLPCNTILLVQQSAKLDSGASAQQQESLQ